MYLGFNSVTEYGAIISNYQAEIVTSKETCSSSYQADEEAIGAKRDCKRSPKGKVID